MIENHTSYHSLEDEWEDSPRKRKRTSEPQDDHRRSRDDLERPKSGHGRNHSDKDKEKSITIASTARLASQAVAPFFAKHIPSQYAPLGDPNEARGNVGNSKDPNSKYCYRHRPDMLCRKQADEPTMDKLQKVRHSIS
jgi:F-box/WD-40 domain protein MET30